MKLTPWEPDLRSLIDRIELGDIDLQPEFQRQEVWSPSKKRRLIDTVLRGWSIPPVHLVSTNDNKLEVLDGQQRLAALRDFMGGKFSIDGRITPPDTAVSELHGKFYKQLSPSTRRTIDQYTLRCFRISDYSPEEPSELFYRLNQPTILTAGEQRNALYGPARAELKLLVQDFSSKGNNAQSIGFSNSRLSYDDIIARILFFVESNNFGIKGSESRISERFRSKSGFSSHTLKKAESSIRYFSDARAIAGQIRLNKANLLSWMLFYSRFESEDGVEFLSEFLNLRMSARNAVEVVGAIDLFYDRSSLRVTDVSSVVFRDVVLWYVFHIIMGRKCPSIINQAKLDELATAFNNGDGSFEEAANAVIDIDEWSTSL